MDTVRTLPLSLEMLLLAAGLIFVLFAGTYKLADSPGIWYDEGYYTQLAMNFAEHGQQLLQVSPGDRKSTRLNSSHSAKSRMPSSA